MESLVVPPVEEMLAKDVVALEAEWEGLSDEALLEEINTYRDAIKGVEAKLTDLGKAFALSA